MLLPMGALVAAVVQRAQMEMTAATVAAFAGDRDGTSDQNEKLLGWGR